MKWWMINTEGGKLPFTGAAVLPQHLEKVVGRRPLSTGINAQKANAKLRYPSDCEAADAGVEGLQHTFLAGKVADVTGDPAIPK